MTGYSSENGEQTMADLSLKEALEQYEAECREVLTAYQCGIVAACSAMRPEWDGYCETYNHLIGACVVWLKNKEYSSFWKQGKRHPFDSLREYLEEVRAHMEGE